MPFEYVPTISAPPKDIFASISYRRNLTKHGKNRNPKLIIGIPKSVCALFKSSTKDKKTPPEFYYEFHIGTGTDKGKARILKTNPGSVGVRATILKGGMVLRFGYVPMLGSSAAEKDMVEVKTIDDGFEITLPSWFKGD